ncbi:MAG TPA: PDZ domain-containing protein [Flavisolibacter sp.]|nr:PDZ domain-containing protein [Flavisolibacter sp.]
MKQRFLTRVLVGALLLCAVPATLLAQDEKAKDKEKTKAKKQQIVITRTGDETGKTVIEIDGDKVKINGKDAADLKDVNVHINNLRGSGAFALGHGNNDFNFNFDFDQPSIFKVDSNRAMLGVVTDGDEKGAEIQSVSKESAAEKAGLKKGDIITKIDNRKIETTDDVTDAVRAHKPGDKISITYLRDGKEQKATTELGRWKGVNMTTMIAPRVLTDQMWRENLNERRLERGTPVPPGGVYFPSRGPKLGMSVQDTDDGKGVKVLDIDDEGSAAKAGLKEGDIITQVDDKAVNGADEISKLIREKKDQPSVKMQILRGGKTQTIDVRIPRKIKTVDL